MKKYLALILALGAAAALAETDVTGVWYADLGGAAAELTLNADGSYRLSVPLEEDKTGTWKLDDGFVYLDGAGRLFFSRLSRFFPGGAHGAAGPGLRRRPFRCEGLAFTAQL